MSQSAPAWAKMVREIMTERKMSERRLAALSGVNRATLRRFLQGTGGLNVDKFEQVLDVLGHDLHLFKRPDRGGA